MNERIQQEISGHLTKERALGYKQRWYLVALSVRVSYLRMKSR